MCIMWNLDSIMLCKCRKVRPGTLLARACNPLCRKSQKPQHIQDFAWLHILNTSFLPINIGFSGVVSIQRIIQYIMRCFRIFTSNCQQFSAALRAKRRSKGLSEGKRERRAAVSESVRGGPQLPAPYTLHNPRHELYSTDHQLAKSQKFHNSPNRKNLGSP